jgi:hypothetical protein
MLYTILIYLLHKYHDNILLYYLIGSILVNFISCTITGINILDLDLEYAEDIYKSIILHVREGTQGNIEGEITEIKQEILQSKDEVLQSKDKSSNSNPTKDDNIKVSTKFKDMHKTLLATDKSSFPNDLQSSKTLPKISDNVPSYGQKLVFHKPSHLLEDRNLPSMSIGQTLSENQSSGSSLGKINEMKKVLKIVEENIELYNSQIEKFKETLSRIDKGTEQFYPNESKHLFNSYLKTIPSLVQEQTKAADQLIADIKKLDPSFNPKRPS